MKSTAVKIDVCKHSIDFLRSSKSSVSIAKAGIEGRVRWRLVGKWKGEARRFKVAAKKSCLRDAGLYVIRLAADQRDLSAKLSSFTVYTSKSWAKIVRQHKKNGLYQIV